MDATTSASFTSTREVLSALQGGQPPLIIDVRREQAFRAATDMIAGALWRDPERVALWAGELPRASRVVAYCVRGHEVSQGVAKGLGEHGIYFNHYGLHEPMLRVPLTTISWSRRDMGQNAASLLIDLIEGKSDSAKPRHITLPLELVIRDSCGARAKGSVLNA